MADIVVRLMADIVVIGHAADDAHVLLVRRDRAPHKGLLALPGGFVEPGETFDAAAVRELAEETGLHVDAQAVRRVGVYDWARPDARYITIVHSVTLDHLPAVAAGDDAADAVWVPVAAALAERLAFDHDLTLRDALRAHGLTDVPHEHGDRSGVTLDAQSGPALTCKELTDLVSVALRGMTMKPAFAALIADAVASGLDECVVAHHRPTAPFTPSRETTVADHEESLLCACGPRFDLEGLHHRDHSPGVTRDDTAACVDVARALAAGLGLDWDTYTPEEQAVTVALANQVFHAIDTAGYDIRPRDPERATSPEPVLPIHNDADATLAHALGDRRGELLRPPGGERP